MIEAEHERLSVRRQCELLGLWRSNLYYQVREETVENEVLRRRLDEQYTETPYYGVRRMTAWLRREGYEVNPKRVRRLMREMGLEAIYPKPKTSQAGVGHRIYPYLLRGVTIDRVHHVWSTDITYIRLHHGHVYLVAVMDWFSRYVLAWELSVTLDTGFCLEALDRALQIGTPAIFNSDQGVQFTSTEFTSRLVARQIAISMDGRGRALDNVFVERLWRSVKQEEVYLHDYANPREAYVGLDRFFTRYNHHRQHQSLDYQTPAAIFFGQSQLPLKEKSMLTVQHPV
jgi:putative transposase